MVFIASFNLKLEANRTLIVDTMNVCLRRSSRNEMSTMVHQMIEKFIQISIDDVAFHRFSYRQMTLSSSFLPLSMPHLCTSSSHRHWFQSLNRIAFGKYQKLIHKFRCATVDVIKLAHLSATNCFMTFCSQRPRQQSHTHKTHFAIRNRYRCQ